MSAIEFQGALALLRWSASEVAVWFGYHRSNGRHWVEGRHAVPAEVAAWLDARLGGSLDDPPARAPGTKAGEAGR